MDVVRTSVCSVLDFVFPPRCAGCGLPGALLCERCRGALAPIDGSRACPRCGSPDGLFRCGECRGRAFAFAAARCASRLEPPVSTAIVGLKDGGERRYARLLAELLAGAAAGWLRPDDVLVPVPASPTAVCARGFDHALDITRALAGITGHRVVRAVAATRGADQRALGKDERFANRAGAFRLAGEAVPARVVLVDDVLTTGATLDAVARVLTGAGAGRVRALAVARSLRRPDG